MVVRANKHVGINVLGFLYTESGQLLYTLTIVDSYSRLSEAYLMKTTRKGDIIATLQQ